MIVDEALDDAEFDSVAIQGSGDEEYYIVTLPRETDEEEKECTQQAAGSSHCVVPGEGGVEDEKGGFEAGWSASANAVLAETI